MKDFFSFDNAGGEYPLLGQEISRGVPTAVFGVSDSHKYYITSLVRGRAVYITADTLSAKRACEAIRALSGKKCALLSAKDEVLTYRKALSKDALYRRLTALYEWQAGAEVLVADIEALVQIFPKRLNFFHLSVGAEMNMQSLVEALVNAGYTREYTVDGKGAFSVRGDILDIYPINCEHPVRIDFFGDEIESIRPYDEVTSERYPKLAEIDIVAATDIFLTEGDEARIQAAFIEERKRAKTSEALGRLNHIIEEITADGYHSDFILPLLQNSSDCFSLFGDALLIFDECKLIYDKLNGIYKEHYERLSVLTEGGEAMRFSAGQYLDEKSLSNFSAFRNLALQTFTGQTYFFNPMKIFNFTSTPARRYLNSLPELMNDLRAWNRTGYRVMIWCGTSERAKKLQAELSENYLPVAPLTERLENFKGIAVLEEPLEKGFLLHECKLAVVGTGDLFTKAASTRRIKKRRGDLFFAPEVGDYAVHEKYGVGKITGTKKIETTDGTKEYVALAYKDGDTLYVPVEQMDVLSKYMGGDNPTLSKIGGGEFERVKAR
ncbi:MAG: hypothetical protein K2K12_03330, partial [Clostridia bacterium]|nr:hypothetical protein [Clostridia bacterium]